MLNNKIRAIISILVFILIYPVVATGCNKQNNATKETSKDIGEKKSISILVEGGSPAFTVAKKTAEEFRQNTGYEVKIDAVPYNGVFDKLRADVAAGAGTYDVATIDILWFPALAKGLLSLEEIVTDEVKNDLLPGVLDGGTYKGVIYGLPTWTNCKTLLFRKDLFEDPKEKENFKRKYGYHLIAPRNWKEYRDIAKFFTRDTNNDGQIDIYGTSVFGANNGDTVCSWLDHSLQAGAKPVVLNEKDEIQVNKKPYVEALQFLCDILNKDKSAPPGALEMSSAETSEMFWNGKLAMILAWGHFYVPSNDPKKSKVAGKVGTAPMIAGDSGIGSIPGPWYQVVPNSSKNQDVSKKYLMFMYEKNALYMDELGVAARKSVFDVYSKKPGYEHLKSISDSLSSQQTQNRPAIREWSQIETEALVPAIQQALLGKKTPQEALDWSAEQIKGILNK